MRRIFEITLAHLSGAGIATLGHSFRFNLFESIEFTLGGLS
jgi:hypothetical protein